MPTCVILGCTSGYISNPEKVSFFRVPNNKITIQLWQTAIRRKDIVLSPKHCVCEKHFLKDEILWQREIHDQSGNVLGVSTYKIPRLKAGAVPSIFQWTENIDCVESPASTETIEIPELMEIEENSSLKDKEIQKTELLKILNMQYLLNVNINMPSASWSRIYNAANNILFFFESTCLKINNLYSVISLKEIIVTDDMRLTVKVLGRPLNIDMFGMIEEPLNDVSQLQDLLVKIDGMKICAAYRRDDKLKNVKSSVLYEDNMNMTRHNNCPILLSKNKICSYCRTAKKILQRITNRYKKHKLSIRLRIPLSPRKQKYLEKMRREKKLSMKARERVLKSIEKWKRKLNEKEIDTQKISQVEDLLEKNNIGIHEREVIKQILAASKKNNPKRRRYSDHWLLLCLLIHMRSPCGYRFLRENNILPIPAVRTIRRYLSIIDTKCGFDANFFELFKTFIEKKEDVNKHGALLIDEISTRESINVKTQNLTYTGLVDFGEDGPQATSVNEKANHALVIMFQPFADSYTQPIAVFASSGPVNGEMISQLIIKAIILVEKAGAKIHAIISDGASTNRKFWTTMGVKPDRCNLKNYFQHPITESRKVFVFSDTPHLMKTIRNRLYNNLKLQMDADQPEIKWDFLKIMHANDQLLPGKMRICPKLTDKHLILTNSAKMRVRFAVQVFSKSVAHGLRFYENSVPELKGCEATADFCEWMNNMFDALNRRENMKGLKPGNPDFKILEQSLFQLDDWEKKVDNKVLDKSLFLTKQTAEGLRITLKSMMDLTCTLVNDFGFSELQSGRVNQDALERFFGNIRQVGGCNDHPATPTFLQIYKILSTFGILKPPSSGNCIIINEVNNEPLLSLSQLKEIYTKSKDKSRQLLRTIKEKLNKAVQNEAWEFENYVEHDYSAPEVIDCVIYCFTANMAHKMFAFVKDCAICTNALLNPEIYTNYSDAMFLNMINNDQAAPFAHPNKKLYLFIRSLEHLFVKHCNSTHVFEEVLNEALHLNLFTFPCTDHKDDIIPLIVQHYIRTRMTQNCKKLNEIPQKISAEKKKSAKYYVN